MEEASIHKWLLLLQLPSLTYFRHRFKMGISLEKVFSVVLSLFNSASEKQPYWSAYEGDRKLRDGEFIVQVIRHLMYLMQISERPIQRRVALAHLCSAEDPYALMTKMSFDRVGVSQLSCLSGYGSLSAYATDAMDKPKDFLNLFQVLDQIEISEDLLRVAEVFFCCPLIS